VSDTSSDHRAQAAPRPVRKAKGAGAPVVRKSRMGIKRHPRGKHVPKPMGDR
jgi:hypothetical protein